VAGDRRDGQHECKSKRRRRRRSALTILPLTIQFGSGASEVANSLRAGGAILICTSRACARVKNLSLSKRLELAVRIKVRRRPIEARRQMPSR
jgi:hypothetical protein